MNVEELHEEEDKRLHFVAGAGIAGIAYYLAYKVKATTSWASWCGLAAAFAAGVGKEGYDAVRGDYTRFDPRDLLATVLGGIALVVVIDLFNSALRMVRQRRTDGEEDLDT